MMRDKSGRGNHATQGTAAARPVYTESGGLQFLAFDGADDSLATGSVDFSGSDKMSVWAGVRKLSDAATGLLLELSADSAANNGSYAVFAPAGGGATKYDVRSKGSTAFVAAGTTSAAFNAPNTAVLSGLAGISNDQCVLRLNGVQESASAVDQGAGNYGAYPIYIGRRGGTSLPFNGNLYGLIVRGAASSALELADSEAYLAGKSGVML